MLFFSWTDEKNVDLQKVFVNPLGHIGLDPFNNGCDEKNNVVVPASGRRNAKKKKIIFEEEKICLSPGGGGKLSSELENWVILFSESMVGFRHSTATLSLSF